LFAEETKHLLMAEAFGIAGSAISVASLLIQLAEKIERIRNFWVSIRDAPDFVLDISQSLEQLGELLQLRASKVTTPNLLLLDIISRCSKRVQHLEAILERLEPGVRSDRKIIRIWYSYKTRLRRTDIKDIQDSLKDAKSDLILANQAEEYVSGDYVLQVLSHTC
jgi:hypothetical protein